MAFSAITPLALTKTGSRTRLHLSQSADLGPGTLSRLEIDVPDSILASDRGRQQRCRGRLTRAELELSQEQISSWLASSSCPFLRARGIERVRVRLARSHAVVSAQMLVEGRRVWLTARVRLRADKEADGLWGHKTLLCLEQVRVHGFAPMPAPVCGLSLCTALLGGPDGTGERTIAVRGVSEVGIDPLRLALLGALPSQGYRLPDASRISISELRVIEGSIVLHFGSLAQNSSGEPAAALPAELLLGDRHLAAGQVDLALAAYKEQEDGPAATLARGRRLAVLASQPARFDEAVALAEEELHRTPDHVGAHLALAAIETLREQPKSAIARYLRLSELPDNTPEEVATAILCAAELLLHEYSGDAVKWLEKAAALNGGPPSSRAASHLAEQYTKERRYQELAHLEERQISLLPKAAHADLQRHHLRLATLYLEHLNDLSRAQEEIDKAMGLGGNNPAVWELEARLLQGRAGHRAEALQALDKAAALSNADEAADIYARAGAVAERMGEEEAALLRYRKALSCVPGHLGALERLADLLADARRLEEAREAYEALLERAPFGEMGSSIRRQALLALSRLAIEMGNDRHRARGYLGRALALGGEHDPEVLRAWAAAEEADGQLENVEKALARLEELGFQDVVLRRAEVLVALKRPEEAIQLVFNSRAALKRPEPPERAEQALHVLILARQAMGDTRGLRGALEQLLELAPENQRAQLELGQVLAAGGDLEGAQVHLSRAGKEPVVLEALIQIAVRRGDLSAQEQTLGELIEVLGTDSSRDQERAGALARQAELLTRLDRKPEAAARLELALSLAPASDGSRSTIGEAALALGRFDVAKAAWAPLLEQAARDGSVSEEVMQIALRLAELGEATHPDAALGHFRLVLTGHPGSHDAARAWGGVLRILSRPSGGQGPPDREARIEALVQAAADPRTEEPPATRADRLNEAAGLREQQGRLEDAVGLYEQTLDLSTRHLPALDALEALAERAGNKALVASTLLRRSRALLDRPAERKILLARLGALYAEHLGRRDLARDAFRQALALDPAFHPGLLFFAEDAREREDYGAELAHLKRLAASIDWNVEPAKKAEVHSRLAVLHRRAGRQEVAEGQARQALDLDAGNPQALSLLEERYSATRRWAELAEILLLRTKIEPDLVKRAKAPALLDTLGRKLTAEDAAAGWLAVARELPEGQAAARKELLSRSIELYPTPDAFLLLGAQEDAASRLDLLRRGHSRFPEHAGLALALIQSGPKDEALAVLAATLLHVDRADRIDRADPADPAAESRETLLIATARVLADGGERLAARGLLRRAGPSENAMHARVELDLDLIASALPGSEEDLAPDLERLRAQGLAGSEELRALARLYTARGRHGEAARVQLEAGADPDDLLAELEVAGTHEALLDALLGQAAVRPDDARKLYQHAAYIAEHQVGDHRRAATLLEKAAFFRGPESEAAILWSRAGQLWNLLGDRERGSVALGRALSAGGEATPMVLMALGDYFFDEGDWDTSARHYRRAFAVNEVPHEEQGRVRLRLASIERRRGNAQAEEQELAAAVEAGAGATAWPALAAMFRAQGEQARLGAALLAWSDHESEAPRLALLKQAASLVSASLLPRVDDELTKLDADDDEVRDRAQARLRMAEDLPGLAQALVRDIDKSQGERRAVAARELASVCERLGDPIAAANAWTVALESSPDAGPKDEAEDQERAAARWVHDLALSSEPSGTSGTSGTPGLLPARHGLRVLAESGRTEAALDIVNAELRRSKGAGPGAAHLRVLHAELLHRLGRADDAIGQLDLLLMRMPEFGPAHALLGRLLATSQQAAETERGQHHLWFAAFADDVEESEAAECALLAAQVRRASAKDETGSGGPTAEEDMGTLFARAAHLLPRDTRPVWALYNMKMDAGRLEEALPILEHAQALGQDPAHVLLQKAHVLRLLGRLDEAEDVLHQAQLQDGGGGEGDIEVLRALHEIRVERGAAPFEGHSEVGRPTTEQGFRERALLLAERQDYLGAADAASQAAEESLQPQSGEALFAAANLALRGGDESSARGYLGRALHLGGAAGGRAQRELYALDGGADPEQRKRALEERLVLAGEPERRDLLFRLMQVAVETADTDAVLCHSEELLASEPGNDLAFRERRRALEERGDVIGLLSLLHQRAAALADPLARAEAMCEAAALYDGMLGEKEQAERHLKVALELIPGHPWALLALADLAYRRGDYQQARGFYDSAHLLDAEPAGLPNEGEHLLRYGELCESQEDQALAERAYRKALERGTGPTRVRASEELSRVYQGQGDYGAAYEVHQQVEAHLPQGASEEAVGRRVLVRLHLAWLALHSGQVPEARRHLQDLLADRPGSPEGLSMLLELHRQTDEPLHAAEVLERLIQITDLPSERADLLYEQAAIFEAQLGAPGKAFEIYQQATDVVPGHVPSLRRLIVGYLRDANGVGIGETVRELEEAEKGLGEVQYLAGVGMALAGNDEHADRLLARAGAEDLAVALCSIGLAMPGDLSILDEPIAAAVRSLGGTGALPLLESALYDRLRPVSAGIDVGARQILGRLAELRGEPSARVHLAVLAFLLPDGYAHQRLEVLGPAPPKMLTEDPMPPSGRGPLRDAMAVLGRHLLGLPAPPLPLSSEWGLRLRPLGQSLGFPRLDVAIVESLGTMPMEGPARCDPTHPPRLRLLHRMTANGAQARFAALRALRLLLSGVSLIQGRSGEDVLAFLQAAASLFLPDVVLCSPLSQSWLADLQALQLRPESLPREQREQAQSALRALMMDANATLASLPGFIQAAQRAAERQALAETGDLLAAILALCENPTAEPLGRLDALNQPALMELRAFADRLYR